MRKFYNEFLYIPRHGKIREKVILARAVVTTVIMLICLSAVSITAYAYFSCNVTSASNVVMTANFNTEISLTHAEGNNETVLLNQIDATNCTADLPVGKYNIKIKTADNSTATTGFCIISFGNLQYHTQQIYLEESVADGKMKEIEFTLQVSAATTVVFNDRWGTSSYYDGYITNGDTEEQYITNGENISIADGTLQ